jgi:beta-phosphoglucomutase-like phosphatase (HAD superfamily)
MQFRLSGEHTHLDVEKLNEQLRVLGADRMRHAMRPDEAFGLIFNWDNCVANTRELQRAAWAQLAAAEGLPLPSIERAIYAMRPERAITEVLQWTQSWGRAQELAYSLATTYAELLAEASTPLPGVVDWLTLVSKHNMPCALVTTLDRRTTDSLLARMGLRHFFSALVTDDDDMETISQRYLSAAIKIQRPPNQCVVFTASPAAITGALLCAHECILWAGRGHPSTLTDSLAGYPHAYSQHTPPPSASIPRPMQPRTTPQ